MTGMAVFEMHSKYDNSICARYLKTLRSLSLVLLQIHLLFSIEGISFNIFKYSSSSTKYVLSV